MKEGLKKFSFKKLAALFATGFTLLTLPGCNIEKTPEPSENDIFVDVVDNPQDLNSTESVKELNIDSNCFYDERNDEIGKVDYVYDINDRLVEIAYYDNITSESRVKKFEYNDDGKLTKVLFYDIEDNLIQINEEETFVYVGENLSEINFCDSEGNVLETTKFKYVDGKMVRVTSSYYNRYSKITSTIDKGYVYDDNDRLTQFVNYDSEGNIDSCINKSYICGTSGNIIRTLYSDLKNNIFKEVVYNGRGHVKETIKRQVDDSSDMDRLIVYSTIYSEFGYKIATTKKYYTMDNKLIFYHVYSFDNRGNCIKDSKFNSENQRIEFNSYRYNDRNQIFASTYIDDTCRIDSSMMYDTAGHEVYNEKEKYDKNNLLIEKSIVIHTYDNEGRIIEYKKKNTDSDGNITYFMHYCKNYVTGSDGLLEISTSYYNESDNLKEQKIEIYDAEGNQVDYKKMTCDGVGNVKEVYYSKDDCDSSISQIISYDEIGNVISTREREWYFNEAGYAVFSKEKDYIPDNVYVNRTTETEYDNECSYQSSKTIKSYDVEDKLIEEIIETYNPVSRCQVEKTIIKYDSNGNMASKSVFNATGECLLEEYAQSITK